MNYKLMVLVFAVLIFSVGLVGCYINYEKVWQIDYEYCYTSNIAYGNKLGVYFYPEKNHAWLYVLMNFKNISNGYAVINWNKTDIARLADQKSGNNFNLSLENEDIYCQLPLFYGPGQEKSGYIIFETPLNVNIHQYSLQIEMNNGKEKYNTFF